MCWMCRTPLVCKNVNADSPSSPKCKRSLPATVALYWVKYCVFLDSILFLNEAQGISGECLGMLTVSCQHQQLYLQGLVQQCIRPLDSGQSGWHHLCTLQPMPLSPIVNCNNEGEESAASSQWNLSSLPQVWGPQTLLGINITCILTLFYYRMAGLDHDILNLADTMLHAKWLPDQMCITRWLF